MSKNYVEIDGKKIRVYQVHEDGFIAAENLEDAKNWYKDLTGYSDNDLYFDGDVSIISPEYKAYKGENNYNLITVRDIIHEEWKGEPFVALTIGL